MDDEGPRDAPVSAWESIKRMLGVKDAKGVLKAVLEPVAIVAITFTATTAVAQPFYVPSGSMQPTLAIGDAFVAAKYPYGYSRYSVPFAGGQATGDRILQTMPKVGDVVVFRLPRDPSQTYIKRVIGLPGDKIQMIEGRLWINGKELALRADGTGQVESEDGGIYNRPRFVETLPNGVRHPIFKWQWSGSLDNTEEFVVPAGHLFMMGDNRDNSTDSRVSADRGGVGFVPVQNLVGRAEFVVGSYDFLNARTTWNWLGEIRLSRFFNGVN